jgi:hypothetical protein
MKKILLAGILILVYNNSIACTTTTVVTGDKTVVCTNCGTIVVCS